MNFAVSFNGQKSYLEITQNFLYISTSIMFFRLRYVGYRYGSLLRYTSTSNILCPPCRAPSYTSDSSLEPLLATLYSGTPGSTRSLTESPIQVKWALYTDNLIQSEKPRTWHLGIRGKPHKPGPEATSNLSVKT